MANEVLVLASASPRRAKILAGMGYRFRIVKTSAHEISLPREPQRTVVENAMLKLHAAGAQPLPVLAADTIVWFDGRIFGKPRDIAEAHDFLRTLGGNVHTVFTGLAFGSPDGIKTACVESHVKFRQLSDVEIADYIAAVHPLDRAGAYDIDESGDRIVESYDGSYENIMGLPIEPVRTWLENLP
ncbi:MAG: septum formation protein Maf [Kiritimatiellae bacterium]|nr:septum formation protein Maf [Kiritimatiellia bacterium]